MHGRFAYAPYGSVVGFSHPVFERARLRHLVVLGVDELLDAEQVVVEVSLFGEDLQFLAGGLEDGVRRRDDVASLSCPL